MAGARKHIFFYFVLAAVCYAIVALGGGGRLAVFVFLAAGIVAELIFWRHLYLRIRRR